VSYHDRFSSVEMIPLRPPVKEEFGFLDLEGEQIYYGRHPSPGKPSAKALLIGPFGFERLISYTVWIRWARALAASGVESFHFDYRGVGESSGDFRQMSPVEWLADARLCANHFSGDGSAPLTLMGIRFGALIASQLFAEGVGDRLLLWGPPKSGTNALLEVLRRKIITNLTEKITGQRKNRSEYVAEMKSGGTIDVEGFLWTQRLWEESEKLLLSVPSQKEARPWQAIYLKSAGKKAKNDAHYQYIPLPTAPFWISGSVILPDLTDLFQQSIDFIKHKSA